MFELPADVEGLQRILGMIRELWLNGARLPYAAQASYPKEVKLIEREIQVLRFTADDLGAKQIAFRLGVSPKTVEFHRRAIMERLGVQGTAGMACYAVKARLLEP